MNNNLQPTPFQLRIKKDFNFSIQEQNYCTPEVIEKLKQMGLPKQQCTINNIFKDSNYPLFNRLEYCLMNCGLECKYKKD